MFFLVNDFFDLMFQIYDFLFNLIDYFRITDLAINTKHNKYFATKFFCKIIKALFNSFS